MADWGAGIEEMDQKRRKKNQRFLSASESDPDDYAKTRDIASEAGMRTESVVGNEEEVVRLNKRNQGQAWLEDLAGERTRKWLLSDKDNAQLAHDQTDGLQKVEATAQLFGTKGLPDTDITEAGTSQLEKVVRGIPDAFQVGKLQRATSQIDFAEVMANVGAGSALTPEQASQREAMLAHAQIFSALDEERGISKPGQIALEIPKQLPNLLGGAGRGIAAQVGTQGVLTAAGLALKRVPAVQAAVLASRPALGAVARVGATTLDAIEQETGAMYRESLNEIPPTEDFPADDPFRNFVVLSMGTLAGGAEAFGALGVSKGFANTVSFNKAVRDQMARLMSDGARNPAVREVFKRALIEGGTEFGQEFAAVVAVEWQKAGSGTVSIEEQLANFSTTDTMVRLFEAALIGTVVGGTFTAVSTGTEVAATEFADRRRADRSIKADEFFEVFSENVTELDRLKKRSPQKMKDAINASAEDGGVDTVMIDTEALSLMFQDEDIDQQEFFRDLPDNLEAEYEEALETGNDLNVSLGDYATQVLDTEFHQQLLPHLRINEDDFTASEAERHQAESDERVKETAERAGIELEAAVKREEQVDFIAKSLEQDLVEAAPDLSEGAADSAKLGAEMIVNLSERSGVPLEEIAEEAGRISINRFAVDPEVPGIPQQPTDDGGTRGSIQIQEAGTVISLGPEANLSTFLHETAGHYMPHVLGLLAARDDVPQQIKDDHAKLLKFAGVAEGKPLVNQERLDKVVRKYQLAQSKNDKRLLAKAKKEINQINKGTEKIARAMETYLREGKAPTQELTGAFQRFQVWLMDIYKDLSKLLNRDVPAPIAEVFDRMIASDEQIEQAQAANKIGTMFKVKPEGMEEPEWVKYQAKGDEAKDLATQDLIQQKLKEAKRLEKEQAGEDRATMEKLVEEELRTSPIHQARQWLANGEFIGEGDAPLVTSQKLDQNSIIEEFGEKTIRELPGHRNGVYTGKKTEGLHHEIVADLFGLTTHELIEGLKVTPTFEAAVEEQTNQELLGLEASPEKQTERILDALHKDPQATLMLAEAKYLKKTGAKGLAETAKVRVKDRAKQTREARRATAALKVENKAVKERAERDVSRNILLGQLRPQRFSAAERRNAEKSRRSVAAGDLHQALDDKYLQLYNHYAYRAARDAQDRTRKIRTRAARITKPAHMNKVEQGGGIEMRRHIMDIASKAKLTSRVAKPPQGTLVDFTGDISLQEGIDIEFDVVAVTEIIKAGDWKLMSPRELEEVDRAITNLDHIGFEGDKVRIVGKQQSTKEAADTITASIRSIHGTPPPLKPGETTAATKFGREKIPDIGNKAYTYLMKIESMAVWLDGGVEGGPAWELFGRMARDAQFKENQLKQDWAADLKGILSAYSAKEQRQLHHPDTRIAIPSIGESLTLMERITAVLNAGNDYNLTALKKGYNWTDAQVRDIADTLSERDLDTVESIWMMLDSRWGSIRDHSKAMSGLTPDKVEAKPFTLNNGRVLEGGYYPLKADSDASDRVFNLEEDVKAGELFGGKHSFSQTRHSHDQARRGWGDKKVLRDLSVLYQHMNEVSHDIAQREYVINTTKILNNKDLKVALEDVGGKDMIKTMRSWIANIATGPIAPTTFFDKLLHHTRIGHNVAVIGFSPTTVIQQPFAMINAAAFAGPNHVGTAVKGFLTDPEGMFDFAMQNSKEIPFRDKSRDREIADQSAKLKPDSILTPARQWGYWAVAKTDVITAAVAWSAAYSQGLNDLGMDHDQAADYGDRVVNLTQGGGAPKDLARIQFEGGEAQKQLTVFYTFFSSQFSLIGELTSGVKTFKNISLGDYLNRLFWLMVMQPLLIDIALFRTPDLSELLDDPDEEDLLEVAKWGAWTVTENVAATLPGGSSAAQAVESQFRGFQIGTSQSVFAEAFFAIGAVGDIPEKGVIDSGVIDHAMAAIMMMGKVPGLTVARRTWHEYLKWMNGDDPSLRRALIGGRRE